MTVALVLAVKYRLCDAWHNVWQGLATVEASCLLTCFVDLVGDWWSNMSLTK